MLERVALSVKKMCELVSVLSARIATVLLSLVKPEKCSKELDVASQNCLLLLILGTLSLHLLSVGRTKAPGKTSQVAWQ